MKLHEKYPKLMAAPSAAPRALRAQELAQALLMKLYAPPSVLIDARCACVGFFGDIQLYLDVDANGADSNLFDIAHSHVRERLKAALKSQWPVEEYNASAECDNRLDALSITVLPLRMAEDCFSLVSFFGRAPCAGIGLLTQHACEYGMGNREKFKWRALQR